MRVLITGGAGFIGGHLVQRLLQMGVQVFVYDLPVVRHRMPKTDAVFIPGSILDLQSLRVALTGIDVINHLAAIADANVVYDNPHYAEEINVRGTINVLEAARLSKTPRVIYGSTKWVYNEVTQSVVDEETPLRLPTHLYPATKLTSENYCIAYDKLYGVSSTILRYGNLYGPRATSGSVIPIFVDKALKGEPLTISGDGSQFRQFVYVDDIAEGNALALKSIAMHNTYNLDGIEKISILQIAQSIKNIVGDVEIEFTPERPGDSSGKECSIEKARTELDWHPKVTFEDGLARYIEWYKQLQTDIGLEKKNVDSILQI